MARPSLSERIARNDTFLRHMSWDGTWARMRALLEDVLDADPLDAPGDFTGTAEAL